MRIGIVVGSLICAPLLAWGDTVTLRNGVTLEGIIVEVSAEEIRIQVGAGGSSISQVVKRANILEIHLGPQKLDSVRKLAVQRLNEGRATEAATLWRYLSALQPDLIENQLGRARALRLAAQLPEAMVAARLAVRLAPQDPRGHQEQAEVALAQGDGREAALRALDMIRFSGTASVPGYLLLARAFALAGQKDDALEAVKNVLKQGSIPESSFDDLASLLLGLPAYVELESLARDRVDRRPRERKGWILLGHAQYGLERFAEASATFKTAITLGGPGFDRARVFYVVADARKGGKDPLSALKPEDQELARELDPSLGRKKP